VLESAPQIAQQLSPTTAHGVALLEKMVTYQAQVIAYNNDFWLMGMLALPILLLLPLMRQPRQAAGGGGHAVMD